MEKRASLPIEDDSAQARVVRAMGAPVSRTETITKILETKTIGLSGGISLIFNNMTGIGIIQTASLFQTSGWFPVTLFFIIFMFVSGFSALFIVEAMQCIPGNRFFQGTVEFGTLINFYFGPIAHVFGQFCLYGALQSAALTSIIQSVQTVDSMFVDIFGKTCGFVFDKNKFISAMCVSSRGISISPFGDTYLLCSFGFGAVFAFVVGVSFFPLVEYIPVQIGSFIVTLGIFACWVIGSIISGLHIDFVPPIGGAQGYAALVGIVMLNYAFVQTVPAWVNVRKPSVSIQKTIWISTATGLVCYLLIGLFPAFAYIIPMNSNLVTVLSELGVFNKVVGYLFSLLVLMTSIPVYQAISQLNILQNFEINHNLSKFICYWAPWLFAIPFQTGVYLLEINIWSSLIFVSTANFVVPLGIYLKAIMFRKRYNRERALTKKQRDLLRIIHSKSESITDRLDQTDALSPNQGTIQADLTNFTLSEPLLTTPTISAQRSPIQDPSFFDTPRLNSSMTSPSIPHSPVLPPTSSPSIPIIQVDSVSVDGKDASIKQEIPSFLTVPSRYYSSPSESSSNNHGLHIHADQQTPKIGSSVHSATSAISSARPKSPQFLSLSSVARMGSTQSSLAVPVSDSNNSDAAGLTPIRRTSFLDWIPGLSRNASRAKSSADVSMSREQGSHHEKLTATNLTATKEDSAGWLSASESSPAIVDHSQPLTTFPFGSLMSLGGSRATPINLFEVDPDAERYLFEDVPDPYDDGDGYLTSDYEDDIERIETGPDGHHEEDEERGISDIGASASHHPIPVPRAIAGLRAHVFRKPTRGLSIPMVIVTSDKPGYHDSIHDQQAITSQAAEIPLPSSTDVTPAAAVVAEMLVAEPEEEEDEEGVGVVTSEANSVVEAPPTFSTPEASQSLPLNIASDSPPPAELVKTMRPFPHNKELVVPQHSKGSIESYVTVRRESQKQLQSRVGSRPPNELPRISATSVISGGGVCQSPTNDEPPNDIQFPTVGSSVDDYQSDLPSPTQLVSVSPKLQTIKDSSETDLFVADLTQTDEDSKPSSSTETLEPALSTTNLIVNTQPVNGSPTPRMSPTARVLSLPSSIIKATSNWLSAPQTSVSENPAPSQPHTRRRSRSTTSAVSRKSVVIVEPTVSHPVMPTIPSETSLHEIASPPPLAPNPTVAASTSAPHLTVSTSTLEVPTLQLPPPSPAVSATGSTFPHSLHTRRSWSFVSRVSQPYQYQGKQSSPSIGNEGNANPTAATATTTAHKKGGFLAPLMTHRTPPSTTPHIQIHPSSPSPRLSDLRRPASLVTASSATASSRSRNSSVSPTSSRAPSSRASVINAGTHRIRGSLIGGPSVAGDVGGPSGSSNKTSTSLHRGGGGGGAASSSHQRLSDSHRQGGSHHPTRFNSNPMENYSTISRAVDFKAIPSWCPVSPWTLAVTCLVVTVLSSLTNLVYVAGGFGAT